MVWTWQPAAASDCFPKTRRKAKRAAKVVKALIKNNGSAGADRGEDREEEAASPFSPAGFGSSIMRRVRRYQGTMMLLTTAGAFLAFSLMTIAVGTDYWLYSRGMCRPKNNPENETIRKNVEVLTHSGLWRTCCTEGTYRGVCKEIEHFPEDNKDTEQDGAEYLLRVVRASSLFPMGSVFLLFLGGLCVAASEVYKRRHNIILTAGILFIAAGLSNVIGIIVYISAMSDDKESKKHHEYGWSFNFGALSFMLSELAGVLAVHVFIEKHRQLRTKGRCSIRKPPPILRSSSFYRNRYFNYNRSRRCSYRSNYSGGGGGGSFHHRASLQPRRDSPDQNHLPLAPPTGVTPPSPPLSACSITPPLQLSVTPDYMLYPMTATHLQAPHALPRGVNGKAGGGWGGVVAATVVNNVNNHAVVVTTPNNVNNYLTGNCAASRRTTPV